MSAVEETALGRIGRRARHGWRVLSTPALWREQLRFLRHGPSPTAVPLHDARFPATPWRVLPSDALAACNICMWEGEAFAGDRHVESQLCPACGASARDRFSFFCFIARTPPAKRLRLTETSPRLDASYRRAMQRWFRYTATDFDESSHRGTVRVDLQDIALPPASVDVLLSAHVLEHVPDTDRALAGIRRTLAPGGRLYLQVPVQDGVTAPPATPEHHEDHTPVFWRFGFDLADRLRAHGLTTTVLVTGPMADAVATGDSTPLDGRGSGWDVPAMVTAAHRVGVEAVIDDATATRLGLCPSYQFAVFEAVVPR